MNKIDKQQRLFIQKQKENIKNSRRKTKQKFLKLVASSIELRNERIHFTK